MRRPIGLTVATFLLGASSVLAAESSPLAPVDWLVGRWQGQGWSEFVPGERREFRSTEIVESRLEGEALVIEGIHWGGPGGEERKVHHALAMVTPGRDGKLEFRSYASGRGGGSFPAWVEGDVFVWEIPSGGGRGTIRYEIRRDEDGRWVEEGTLTTPDGEARAVFGMVLTRQDEDDPP